MNNQLVKEYLHEYGEKYLHKDVFEHYPEVKVLPAYIKRHFSQARTVLDLGFGSGLWFWASFLPALERIDGIDLYQEALEEANRIFDLDRAPAGYRLVHGQLGEIFTLLDLQRLKAAQGQFSFQDYREPWPVAITRARYDLVTEHGGGLGQMSCDAEVMALVEQVSRVLKPGGCLLFTNFVMQSSPVEKKLGRVAPPSWRLTAGLIKAAVREAGLNLADLHTVNDPIDGEGVDKFFYGYARRE